MKSHLSTALILCSLLCSTASAQSMDPGNSPNQERVIQLDFNKVKGSFSTMFKECIGAGRANEGLRADWQRVAGEESTAAREACRAMESHGRATLS